MKQAGKGCKVRVHYTGTYDDGTVFDSSVLKHQPPLEFTVGAGQMIPGFDCGVEGMTVGETRKIRIPAKEAYGEHKDNMVFEISKDRLPSGYTPSIGDHLRSGSQDFIVKSVGETTVVIDGNHPMAGKDLNFEIQMMEID